MRTAESRTGHSNGWNEPVPATIRPLGWQDTRFCGVSTPTDAGDRSWRKWTWRIETPARQERGKMNKLFAAFIIALFVAPLGAQQPSAKKPVTHDVYDGWKSIQGTKVSRDGMWVAYALVPQDGDGELVVHNLKTNREYHAPRGRNPVITPDSTFVVFEKSPLKADVDKARKAKRRPDEMPKAGVGLIELSSGQVTTLAEHVKSFRLPEDPIRMVAYLAAPEPAPRARGQ